MLAAYGAQAQGICFRRTRCAPSPCLQRYCGHRTPCWMSLSFRLILVHLLQLVQAVLLRSSVACFAQSKCCACCGHVIFGGFPCLLRWPPSFWPLIDPGNLWNHPMSPFFTRLNLTLRSHDAYRCMPVDRKPPWDQLARECCLPYNRNPALTRHPIFSTQLRLCDRDVESRVDGSTCCFLYAAECLDA